MSPPVPPSRSMSPPRGPQPHPNAPPRRPSGPITRPSATLNAFLLLVALTWSASPTRAQPAGAPTAGAPSADPDPADAPPAAEGAEAPGAGEGGDAPPDGPPIRRRGRAGRATGGADAGASGRAAADPEAALISEDRVPLRLRAPSQAGPIGLDQVWSADPGAQGTVRLRLGLAWFDVSDWPVSGSDNQFTGTTLALGWTPIKYLEVFSTIRSTSNTNEAERPSLLQTQGDVSLGAKGGGFFSDSLAAGAAAVVHLLGGPGSAGAAADATGFELRALFTVDLQRKRDIPFRFLFDFSYYFENGRAVFDGQPGLPSIVEEWGLQVGAYDRMMLGFGFEAPIWQWINPYAEYRIGTPFLVRLDRRGEGSRAFAFGSVPHNLMFGVRSLPAEGLALDLGARVGLSDQPFTGVPATPPWTLVAGVSYTLDPRPKVIERTVEPETPAAPAAPPTGGVVGKIKAADTGGPLAEARISFPGQVGRSAQLTAGDGTFAGYTFPPGELTVEAHAPKYLAKTARVRIEAGQDAQVELSLDPDPQARAGTLELRVFDDTGGALPAQAVIGPPADRTVEVPAVGGLRLDLPPGTYPLRIESEGFAPVERSLTLRGGQTETIRQPMTLAPGGKRPRKAKAAPEPRAPRAASSGSAGGPSEGAVRRGKLIKTGTPIGFGEGTATLTADGRRAVDAVAALLKRDPKIKQVLVEAHTDGRGDSAQQKALSDQQAAAVKAQLVRKGIPPARVRAVGKGGGQPLAPNVSAAGRAKNRRVVLRIVE